MKRYKFVDEMRSSYKAEGLEENETGEWVKFEEAQAEIDRLTALNRELVENLKSLFEICDVWEYGNRQEKAKALLTRLN